MKERILRTIKLLTAYVMLSIGVLCWIRVSSVSGGKLDPAQTAMAEIKKDPGSEAIEISLLGESRVFDLSVLDSENVRTLVLACADPVVIGVLGAVCS